MEMFLMTLGLALFGVAVSAALFATATVDERRAQAQQPERALIKEVPQRFFAAPSPAAAARRRTAVPADVLLLHLEQHVRLEQAAAELFHQSPTPESLHTRTTSPLRLH